jgi:hypothetical protein
MESAVNKFESREDFLEQMMDKRVISAYQKDNGVKPHLLSAKDIIQYVSDNTHKKYIIAIMKWYVNSEFRLEDCERIKGDIDVYVKHKSKLAIKDLNKYENLGDFYRAIQPFENVLSTNEQEKVDKETGTTKLWDLEHFKVYEVSSFEAAAYYGRGTKWCTTNKEQCDHYLKDGPLFIIMAGERKFQLHYESGQFMDEIDQTTSKEDIDLLSDIPEYFDYLNYMIGRYYSE